MPRAFLPSACAGLAMLLSANVPAAPLTLIDALQHAIDSDPAVMVSQAQRDADIEAGVQERATRLPVLSATGTLNETHLNVEKTPFPRPGFSENYSGYSASVELRQPLFRYDWFARGRRAEARDQLAEQAFRQRAQALMTRIAERYLAVVKAGNELRLAEAEAGAVRRSLDDTRKRYQVQAVPGTDLKEALARDDLSQARLLAARQTLEAARDQLDESTGHGRDALAELAPATPLPLQPAGDVQDWVARALDNSPVLQQARLNRDIARADLDSRRSDGLPSLDLVGIHSRQDQSRSALGSKSDNSQVALELKVPLFSSGLATSVLRQADARHRAAEAEVLRQTRVVSNEVRRLARDLDVSQAQVAAFARAETSARAAEQAVRYGYEAGKRTITDVLNAQSAAVQARRNLDQARYDSLLKRIQLQQAAGLLTPDDLAAVDRLLTPAP